MISAIVLAATLREDENIGLLREVVVRSLVWLVSAVISGVVRDVTLSTPFGLGLSEVADQSGCNLVQADGEAERIADALSSCRTDRVLIVRAGYEPDGRLIDELDAFIRRQAVEAVAFVRAAPETLIQRVLPDRAPIIGVLLPKAKATEYRSFNRLVSANRHGTTLRTRAVRIP